MSDEHNNDNGSVEHDDFVSLNQDIISGLQDRFGADMRVCVDRGPMTGTVTPSPEHEGGTPMSYDRTYRKTDYRRYTRHYKRHYKRHHYKKHYKRHYSRSYDRSYKRSYDRSYNRGKHLT
jgi:hypothetical protein